MSVAKELRPPATYSDYRNLSDDEQYELIRGDFYITPSPLSFHQTVVGNIFALLSNHTKENDLGRTFVAPMDVKLTETDVVQPDILYIQENRTSIIKEAYIRDVPDLTVEVLSDATRDRDTVLKRNLYFKHGVKEYWLVDPGDHTVSILVPGDKTLDLQTEIPEGDFLQSTLFPDFHPSTNAFFET